MSPLPQRDGIDPVHVRLPLDGGWETVREYLAERYGAAAGEGRIAAMLAAGEFLGPDGPITAGTPYRPGGHVWFHREPGPPEPVVPFAVEVLHRDERIVVADKPHFLATTPRGSHAVQTALARLRHDLGLPRLSPAHRLDRLTAGVVLFVADPALRGAYQGLFERREAVKEYEAIARHDPAVALPAVVRSRILKDRGRLDAYEAPGVPNAESRVELVEVRAGLGRYRLAPRTGRTHQLRVHMNGLGLPLLGDPLYPAVLPDPEVEDYRRPLQLLARSLEFTDPVSGGRLRFESTRQLAAWQDPAAWAG
ncbi:pseudouridine synthase [Streptomyces sp. TLI_171]|uniref:pseudouridine synthase n=1 Tax=Streptomyces sp. TLI_171 TaxID=1938859 RepID=UPI000C17FB8D|nr:pseudouridine synthase [Streptomyces sp. TLI_171]RKE17155.1 23S rRNA-/tRNA-specific pseudouridylate synthase [Streptomyces sp. TLI_171]